jgi:hypothetical protein
MRQHLANLIPKTSAMLQIQKLKLLNCVGRMLFHHHTDISKVVQAAVRIQVWADPHIQAVVQVEHGVADHSRHTERAGPLSDDTRDAVVGSHT